MPPISRWTDDRLDDLASVVHGNDHRLDTVQDMAQTNQRDIRDIIKALDIKARSRVERAVMFAALLSPAVTLAIWLAGGH